MGAGYACAHFSVAVHSRAILRARSTVLPTAQSNHEVLCMTPRLVAVGLLLFVALCSPQASAKDKKSNDKNEKKEQAQPAAAATQAVLSPDAPKPIGPYSQGIKAGDFIFLAGQTGADPATGQV